VSSRTTSAPTRRAVIAGACGAACATALSACTTYGPGGPAAASAPSAPAAPTAQAAPGAAQGVASTADVPVGGGTILADQELVITQPVAGQFQAFSTTCTHQGCAVSEVADGTIICPCHGSKFAIADGSVVDGPASAPLERRNINVEGDSIVLA
jgi:Rieske Fe-S protein